MTFLHFLCLRINENCNCFGNVNVLEETVSVAQSLGIPRFPLMTSECQIDASWHATDSLCGFGWVLIEQDRIQHLYLKSSRRCLSPYHAEVESLLWAMCRLRSLGISSVSFTSDFSDMIAMIENEDEWPSFAVELATFRSLLVSFPSFNISFLPRNSNIRADTLDKKARVRGTLFSHVSSSVLDWLFLKKSFFRYLNKIVKKKKKKKLE